MFGLQSALFLAIGLIWLTDNGLAKPEIDTHIVGGKDAPDKAYPYQVSLRKKARSEYHSCGGSIVKPEWVLSAAHCTFQSKPEDITVVAGSNKLSSGGSRHKVAKIINHESYVSDTLDNDICLIQVETAFKYSDHIAPIALTDKATPGGVKCVVSGWGYIDNQQTTTDKLQYLETTTITYDECKASVDKNQPYYLKYLHKENLCTFKAVGQGFCQGDSGGPLVADSKQVGIVSWGRPCGNKSPDVFVSVFAYLDWIKKNLGS